MVSNSEKPDSRTEAGRAAGTWQSLLRPIHRFRGAYLPVVLIYFSYGALGLIDVSRDLWIKESLTLTPAELAGLGVWLTLPWTIKMVFGELVDSIPIFGSQRTSYVVIGAVFVSAGLIVLADAAGGWLILMSNERSYVLGAMLIVTGTVIQDVVADAMSTEVVQRIDASGKPLSETAVRTELGMVQVLGRLALSAGILVVAGLSGWLAELFSRETVFLSGLVIPVISILGILIRPPTVSERRPLDKRILGGGLAFGTTILLLTFGGVSYAQEITFLMSMFVICGMLVVVTRDLDASTRRAIVYTSIVIFVFRASPTVGDGYFWWTLDVLKFDAAFYGILRQTAAIISLVAMWIFSKQLTEYPVARILLWVVVAGSVLSLPNIGLIYGLHDWTEAQFGFGARFIALIDAATSSPFAQLSMIPLLTLIAIYAPAGRRATWFALMASLMNLALVAGQLQTKYLNQIFVVTRGNYTDLGQLLIVVVAVGFIVPMLAIAIFGRLIDHAKKS